MTVLVVTYAFGVVWELFTSIQKEQDMRAAGITWRPPGRFWLLNSALWFVPWLLFFWGVYFVNYEPYKAWQRTLWPGKQVR